MATFSRRICRGFIGMLLGLLLSHAVANGQTRIEEEKDGKEAPGVFVPIAQAKDCAFDHVRQRLYVTTLKQLVVVDMRERKVLEAIDLLGNVQGIDISPQAGFLAIAPIEGQYVYKLNLDWKTTEDMEFTRIKFNAPGNEPGVFGIGIGAEGSILFSTTFAGSGWVTLRRINPDDSVADVGRVRMNSVIAVSGDRQQAFVGEGNISSGPLLRYDFKSKTLTKLADLQCFHYELACSADGSRIARPERTGCDLYDAQGRKLGALSGAPVMSAAFHPKSDSLYVLRHGELNIQEYNLEGKLLDTSYPLDKPLVIQGDVNSTVIADLQPVGRDVVMANFRQIVNVNFRAYQSGRLHVSEDGQSLCAVVPSGVYIFPIQKAPAEGAVTKPRVKIIDK
jgi:hypothetical protein